VGVWGQLRIVPSINSSEDIGSLGIKEGTATIYPWKWYYSMPAFGIWIFLALAILLFKDNRDPRVLLILIPIFIIRLLWSLFLPVLGVPTTRLVVFGMLVDALVIGLAVLWLLAYKLGNRNRFISVLLAFIVLLAATFIAVVSNQTWSLRGSREVMVVQVLEIVIMLLVFVLAGWCCRKQYGPKRFMLWLAFWTIVISLVGMFIYFLISMRPSADELINQIPEVLVGSLILAITIYMLNLPFLILAFASTFYRERFYAYFRLKSMLVSSPSVTEKPHGGDLEQTE